MLNPLMPTRPEFIAETRSEAETSLTELALGPDEAGSRVQIEAGIEARPASAPLTRHRRPLFALTGLRFFASMYVVAFHTRLAAVLLAAGYPHLGLFFRNGFLAVPLFFVLSGFILSYTYRGQISDRGSPVRFWEARFSRLWPAYAFSLLFSSLPVLAVPHWPLALATLAMVQAWNPWHPEFAGTWNFVCWTLSVEAFFYVLFPWIQRCLERLHFAAVIFFGFAVLAISIMCNVSARSLGSPQYPAPWDHIPLPVIHLPEFLIGAALGNLFIMQAARSGRSDAQQPRWPVITLCGVVLSVAALSFLKGSLTSVILLPFALLITGLAFETSLLGNLLSTRALLLGGAISYSIYLLQTPVRTMLYARYALKLGWPGLAFMPSVLLPLAYLAYRFIEEPSRTLLRRVFAKAHGLRASSS